MNAASAAINHVTLTTDAQVEGGYDVTLAATVTNLQGVAPAPLSARFCGYSAMGASMTLSEVNPSLPGSADLLELTVTRGGPLTGFTVRSNPTAAAVSGTLLATMPAICAATGDIVVVHLTPAADPAASETLAKDQFASAAYAQNYDGAWDVRGGSSGLAATNLVIAIRDPAGSYLEGVAFSSGAATTPTSREALAYIQAVTLWTPPTCGGAACDDASVPTAQAISASWSGVGTTAAGSSARRTGVTTDASAWSVGASSFGAGN